MVLLADPSLAPSLLPLSAPPPTPLSPGQVAKVERDVRERGLGLVVVADWFSAAGIKAAGFFDDNTRSQWAAVTGGANVPGEAPSTLEQRAAVREKGCA